MEERAALAGRMAEEEKSEVREANELNMRLGAAGDELFGIDKILG